MAKKKKEQVIEAVVLEDGKDKIIKKPYFFPRLIAYIIDVILVSIICFGVMFIIPKSENYSKYVKEFETIQMQFMDGEISEDEYFNKSVDVVYDVDYSNSLSLIIQVLIIILYFIVFQFYNKGQTFGKKLMKLRVVSTDGCNATMNQIAIRTLIINSILVNILIIGSLLFLGRDYYYYASLIIQRVSVIITFVIVIMLLLRKDGRGLHDVFAKTQVIQEEV